jgi:hypothetical protein
VKLVRALDKYALRSWHDVDEKQSTELRNLCERLREEIFWREKNFSVILDLVDEAEKIFAEIKKKIDLHDDTQISP